ncbi:MAG: ATP-binding protein [Prevotella sp.]|nr:AAA family ATPase [Prevotella sp.]MDD7028489.1 ATP-binding protein [Prevotellaceae bacterium]MDD7076131.1 ATP-binding protein [Prevotellaceae bacterium]MDY5208711.1 ATP-binding protein [Prevotella sp.]MDY5343761.1 ATP-binding protein [Prevotella sp.]
MERLNNPFVIYGYKGAEYFCDRQKETETIMRALHNERNVALISPRRIGKTGLIHHAFAQITNEHPDIRCFYMDINATRNLQQFVELFAKTFSITVSNDQKEESLKHVLDYLKDSDKRIYVAIDEFQQISEYPEKNVEALLRSHIQFIPNVVFVFAGSKQHIMAEMFTSAKRPFYQSSQMLSLSPIDKKVYCEFANNLMEKKCMKLSEDVFGYVYDIVDGQTWYVQHILNRLYDIGGEIDIRLVNDTIMTSVMEQEVAFLNYYESLTYNQSQLLLAIARDKAVESVLSQDFIHRHSLPASSSVSLALKALIEREFVYKYNGKFIIYDRFFAIWLRNL